MMKQRFKTVFNGARRLNGPSISNLQTGALQMRKLTALTAMAAFGLTTSVVHAAPLVDDFSSDTSANYTGSNSFNSGGSFDISGGTLNVTAGTNNTFSVVHNTSSLGIGETFSIDVVTPSTGAGNNSGGSDAARLMLTTGTGQPNGSSTFGFRLRIDSNTNIKIQTYSSTSSTNVDTGVSPTVAPDTFWIDRVTATSFEFYYGSAGSRTLIGTGNLEASDVVNPIHVGVQGFANPTELHQFDNLQIQAISSIPEPGSLALLGMGGLLMLRRNAAQTARRRRD